MRTRIACYFDVPRPDSRADYANYVDVRPPPVDRHAPPRPRPRPRPRRSSLVRAPPRVRFVRERPPASPRARADIPLAPPSRVPPPLAPASPPPPSFASVHAAHPAHSTRTTLTRAPPPLAPPTIRHPQIDLKKTDTKNDLKRKVAIKVGVPFERLRMRLGPFREVHVFDKLATNIRVSSCGQTCAIQDTLLPHALELQHFGAKDHELPEWTPEGMGDHPLADWCQEWEDVEAGLP